MIAALELLGGLGVFLYGLRLMSESLQKVAGERLRAMLAAVTRNRMTGVLAGLGITTIVQSSSATTVLIVAFANAGLLTLVQAIGPVMGANIGTTVTAWLVALLGFKVKITAFALPAIGLGFPLTFLKSEKAREWGHVALGFGLLFLGLAFMKEAIPSLSHEQMEFLNRYSSHGFLSTLLFVGVGTTLTIILQSSSATMAMTMIMANQGWIGFDQSVAMVLGENIGTTITANLAAIGANRVAKRVARVHLVFNLIGVAWVLPLLFLILRGVDAIVPGDPYADATVIKDHLATFHTGFNVTNTLLLVWFVPQLARLATRMVPMQPDERGPGLRWLPSAAPGTPQLAVMELRKGLSLMVDDVRALYEVVRPALGTDGPPRDVVDAAQEAETRTDVWEKDIISFASNLANHSAGSVELSGLTAGSIEGASQLELLGDNILHLAYLARRMERKGWLPGDEARADLTAMAAKVAEQLEVLRGAVGPDGAAATRRVMAIEDELDALRTGARKRVTAAMEAGRTNARMGVVLIDMYELFERIGDRCRSAARCLRS